MADLPLTTPAREAPLPAGWACKAVRWDGDLSSEIVSAWRQVLATLEHPTVYQYPEWISLACRHGLVKPWRVLLLTRRGVSVGVLPLQRVAPFTLEAPAPLAADHPAVVIDPAGEAEALSALYGWLRQHAWVRMLGLGRHDTGYHASLLQEAEARGCFLTPVDSNMTIPLHGGWEGYLARLGANTRSGIRRMERQFLGGVSTGVFEALTEPEACVAALEEFMALHRARWRAVKTGSVFDEPGAAGFYRDVLHWAARSGMAALFRLRDGDTVLAVHTLFFAGGSSTASSHIIARSQGKAPATCHSPGNLLNALTVRWAIERGFSSIDLHFGNVSQKGQIGAVEYPSSEIVLARTASEMRLFRQLRWRVQHLQRLAARLQREARLRHDGALR